MRPLDRGLAYVHANLTDRIGLDEVAAAALMSRFHFARRFRRETGSSVMRYIAQQRVERAKLLLAANERTIAEISAALGFCDQSHFCRVFRRHAGVAPRDYSASTRPARVTPP